jgi:hypothetical protein
MKSQPPVSDQKAPEFGSREYLIYRYGILDAARRGYQSEKTPREMPQSEKDEMRRIESDLGMAPREILASDFAQMGVGSGPGDIGAN